MTLNPAALQQVLDRASIRAVIEGYMAADDRCDYDAIAACFTADAELEYCATESQPLRFTGGRALADWMQSLAQYPTHTHTVSSCEVNVEGDTAQSEMFGLAIVVLGSGGPGSMMVRGLHYTDTFVRTERGWLISKRTHTGTWQFAAAAEPVVLPLQP